MSPPFNMGAPLPLTAVPLGKILSPMTRSERIEIVQSNLYKGNSFNPSPLSWSGWWRAGDYSSAPAKGAWTPTASAGISGNANQTLEANTDISPGTQTKPTLGSTIGGYAPVVFNGTSNQLNDTRAISDYIGNPSSAWTLAVLFNVTAVSSNSANVWSNPMIVGDHSTFWGMYVADTGGAGNCTVSMMQWDGADKHVSKVIAKGAWVLGYATYNGSVISFDCGGGASTQAAGNTSNASNRIQVGQALTNPLLNGIIAEIMFSTISAVASRAQLVSYLNGRYGLGLLV